MKTIQETLETEISAETDVLVCGGGPAGCAAAIAAARNGCSVILTEYQGFLGGVPAAAGVNGIGTFYWDLDGRVLISGIPQELVSRIYLASDGNKEFLKTIFTPREGAPDYKETFGGFFLNSNPEMVKIILDEMMREAGVRVLLETQVVRPLMEGKKVIGAVTESKSGRRAILAGTVIDCTGDGDIAARAGAEFETGRPEDHLCQPMSQIFVTSGTNYPELYYGTGEDPDPNPLTRFRFRGAVKDAREKGILKENPNDILCAATPLSRNDPTVRAVNFTRIQKYSALDTDQKSAALAAGRRQVLEAMNFIRSYVPGGSNAKLAQIYTTIGVRESRRITGEYRLTAEDVMQGRRFPDSIARGLYLLDIHNPDKVGVPSTLIRLKQPYDIPFRILVPRGLEGILVAGRCVSTDHVALSSCRIMSHCMAMGEAAGTAAALAKQTRTAAGLVDPSALQSLLSANGANPRGPAER